MFTTQDFTPPSAITSMAKVTKTSANTLSVYVIHESVHCTMRTLTLLGDSAGSGAQEGLSIRRRVEASGAEVVRHKPSVFALAYSTPHPSTRIPFSLRLRSSGTRDGNEAALPPCGHFLQLQLDRPRSRAPPVHKVCGDAKDTCHHLVWLSVF